MIKPREIETDEGIQDEVTVEQYDLMQRRMRRWGILEADTIINSGISKGLILEVGPGPGYLGLEVLKKTDGTRLKGLDISPAMIKISEKNAKEYGFSDRAEYVLGDSHSIPFRDNTFDGVFSNRSLHEWSDPESVFNEIYRVLKPGGRYCICDLRRDVGPLAVLVMKLFVWKRDMRAGLVSSINASYTKEELEKIIKKTKLRGASVSKNIVGLSVSGGK